MTPLEISETFSLFDLTGGAYTHLVFLQIFWGASDTILYSLRG